MMTNEEIKQEIIKAMRLLETVDFNSRDTAIKNSNSRKVHQAYEKLFELNKRL